MPTRELFDDHADPRSSWCTAAWEAIISHYRVEGVASACLRLQDEYDVDVIVLLACMYAAGHGRDLDESTYEVACRATARVRDGLVRPLRELRRQIAGPEGTTRWETLRTAMIAAELEAERGLLAHLEALLDRPEAIKAPLPSALLAVVKGFIASHAPRDFTDTSSHPELVANTRVIVAGLPGRVEVAEVLATLDAPDPSGPGVS